MSDKIKKEIFNGVGENVRALAQLFPSAVKDGEVDFAALKQELGEFVEVGAEKYDFTWAGKAKAKAESVSDVLGRTLKYVKGDGVDENATQNLYIEGDNLEALKLLRNSYYGKIKMIYIDPPYNTGNDFVYKDNFAMTEEEKQAMAEAGEEIDEYGERLVKNNGDNSKYHTNWLNMMYPRLKIARDLLTDDGVIFISIDDNEVENLKKICNEIFGENNFIAEIVIASNSSKNNSKFISISHEYVLSYAKNKNNIIEEWKVKKNQAEEYVKRAKSLLASGFTFDEIHKELLILSKYPRFYDFDHYTYADNKGVFRTDNAGGVANGNLKTEIIHPITNKACQKPSGGWRYKEEEIKRLLDLNMFYFGEDESVIPQPKRYLNDYVFQVPKSLMFFDSQSSTKWLKSELLPFDFAKPIELLKHIMSIFPNSSLILDFFSGSATTAHAVMQLNAEDGGNRKFICVQLPEPCAEDSEAFKAGYKNICEIGKERIRRAGKKIADTAQCPIKDTKQEDVSNDVNREAIPLDIGFKVFKVADTNIRMFSNELNNVDLLRQLDIRDVDQERMDFNNGATDLDVCYELLLRHRGIPLSSKIVNAQCAIEDKNNRTYIIADSIVVCLEQTITQSLVEQLAAIDPLPNKYIFRDSSFGDDISLKENTMIYLQAIIEKNSGASKKTYTVEFI